MKKPFNNVGFPLVRAGALLLFGVVLTPTLGFAWGSPELDKKTSNTYIVMDASFIAHRSEAINATDFGSEYEVTVGTWATKTKGLGLGITYGANTTKFTQSDAQKASTWTNFFLTYRLAWFYPSVTLGSCNSTVEDDGIPLADTLCTTSGGGLDVRIPAGPNLVVEFGLASTQVSMLRDSISNENSISSKQEYHVGVDIYPKVDWVSFLVGFCYRYYWQHLNDIDYKEIETGPHVGIMFRKEF